MSASHPIVLALDFDGVVCDGLREYFQTAWRAYCHIWQPDDLTPIEDLAPKFYRLRPVVETGWEMPILIRALVLGIEERKIFQNWVTIAAQIIIEDALDAASVSAIVDDIRDQWIATDLDSWLGEHRFYPGVIERLREELASSTDCVIISTKEGRFIKQLLQQQGITLTDQQIYGKEVKRPKYQILKELNAEYGEKTSIWFVEDRLKTLEAVKKQQGLENVMLFLADWGYNTIADQQSILDDDRIHLLSLEQFTQDFATWVPQQTK
ncbi:haloacid dehalogenase [Phormidesmis priestleyi ULC007]|uniref:Haloacid dehalogenase n=1 Tax=Phormidesmis priestleyi ULC007 TaxID=1920490 RepID=A0A2T1D7V8_9CYAN|nr:haloacid dehalogenase [Phormidesmis priestleyi]PSB16536.1 haloacid dehalogenase [Phormidesmis priestleyi ULC007]PZO47389.1 MAG: haloacid dehalogenase [Phormidesmis priestleyi]